MSGWKLQTTKKIDLPEDVADGLWIRIHNPKMLPFEVMESFMSMSSTETFELKQATDLATVLILDWNLPGEDGAILPIPSNDPEVWRKLPARPVIEAVFGELRESAATAEPDPNSLDGSASS